MTCATSYEKGNIAFIRSEQGLRAQDCFNKELTRSKLSIAKSNLIHAEKVDNIGKWEQASLAGRSNWVFREGVCGRYADWLAHIRSKI